MLLQFFRNLAIALGIPEEMANFDCFLNTNMGRMIKITDNYGPVFWGNVGAGQGNVLAIFSALGITTVQFRLVSDLHPQVSLSSVVDDRTFRGRCLLMGWQRHMRDLTFAFLEFFRNR